MARITAHQMFERVRADAKIELERSSVGLAFSGLSAGLNISFSFVAIAAVMHATGRTEPGLLAAVVYPVGFIIIVLARAQLFSENTLTPVLLVLDHPSREHIVHTARLWVVVLAFNLLGAWIFAIVLAVVPSPDVVPHVGREWLDAAARASFRGSWIGVLVRGVFGGWLVALMAWMVHSGEGAVSEILVVWTAGFLISAAGFAHSVAGATEVLYLAGRGIIGYGDWFWRFQVPVTLGNAIGGVVFVSLVNYAQVRGSGEDVEVARRIERERAIKEKKEEAVAASKAQRELRQGRGE
ncbi:MAG TPA: formate/nitrite transporter family protein [Gemmatimonadaceae bacterium]